MTVHADVAETIDALLRGDPVAPELRWRDEGGVHRTQSRPKPSPNPPCGPGERFSGLVGAGLGWRVEPGWRPDARESAYRGGSAAGALHRSDRAVAAVGVPPAGGRRQARAARAGRGAADRR